MTPDLIRDIATWVLIGGGSLFVLIGAFGIIRMPDVFTRMHAASLSDTIGAILILAGCIVEAGLSFATVRLVLLILLLLLAGPVSTHALARAALQAGIRPLGADETRPAKANGNGSAKP